MIIFVTTKCFFKMRVIASFRDQLPFIINRSMKNYIKITS